MSKRVLITGITGQDGSYLAEFLLEQGYEVYGMVRRASTENFERIAHLIGPHHAACRPTCSTSSRSSTLLQESRPQEVYNLAAQSFVPTSWKQPRAHRRVHRPRASRACSRRSAWSTPSIRFYQASQQRDVRQGAGGAADGAHAVLPPLARTAWPRSTGTGSPSTTARPTTSSPCSRHPLQPRVAAARAGVRDAQDHRRRRPHQARPARRAAPRQPRRPARLGLRRRLRRAMWLMLQQRRAGRLRRRHRRGALGPRIRRAAFAHVGLDYGQHVKIDPRFIRPAEVDRLIGDPRKARDELGWTPTVSFAELVRMMVDADVERLRAASR